MKTRTNLLCLLLMILLALGTQTTFAQTDAMPLILRSVGLIDQNDTVLYSVFLASGAEELAALTASVAVPEGMTLQESVLAPESVEVSLDGNMISWSVEALAADTLLGPLTFRVAVDNADIPAGLEIHAVWAAGELIVPQSEDVLVPLATEGSIEVDAGGTIDEAGQPAAVTVGDTGLWLYVPAGAVAEPTTLTFERLPVPTGDAAAEFFPPEAEGTWWCSVVNVTIEGGQPLSEPVMLAIPSRRVVTPGLASGGFWRFADGDWQVMEGSNIFVAPDGAHTIADGIMLTDGMQVAYGVNDSTRLNATIDSATLTTNITDGTSNTVQQYVQQPSTNIIAILIGRR